MGNGKKIICLIDSLGAGGAQRQMVGLATILKEHGYEVIVGFYYPEFFYANHLSDVGVPWIYLKGGERIWKRLFFVEHYIRKNKPDVLISYLDTPNICACLAHILNRHFKLIVSERTKTQKTGWREKLRFNLFRFADYVVPNAYSQANYVNQTFPFLSSKLSVIPNFVDLQRFTPLFHHRHQVPEIIVVATIYPPKNTLGFIDAVELLAKDGILFHVSWYGKDLANIEYFIECQKKIKEKRVEQYISLLDKTNNISVCFREADYFCLPSFYEGTPNALCEAMASGLPILCSNVCDNPRYVEEGVNGFMFNPNDVSDMAKTIRKMLQLSDHDYSLFCRTSRKYAEEKFSKERFVNDYVNLIENPKA